MDQSAIDQRESVEWMLSELESMDLSKRKKTQDYIECLRTQFGERLSLSPGQFQKLQQIYMELTDV